MKKRPNYFSKIGIIIIVLLAIMMTPVLPAQAAGLTVVSVDMNDSSGNNVYATSTAIASTVVVFNPDTRILDNDGIQIEFESDFDISAVVNADVSVAKTGGTITKGTAARSLQLLQIPITTGEDVSDNTITVTVANSHITTPSGDGTYLITITTWDLGDNNAFGGSGGDADTLVDSGSAAVVIKDASTVVISGTVDPTLTLVLSDWSSGTANTCTLGTLDTTNIKTCSYKATITTNATGGYSAYIREDDGLKNSAANEITETASGYVTSNGTGTDEEYGLGVDTTDTTDVFPDYSGVDTCANLDDQSADDLPADAITGSDQRFAYYSTPVDGSTNGVTTLCHGAAIIGTTPAGVYSHTVTITVVGNF